MHGSPYKYSKRSARCARCRRSRAQNEDWEMMPYALPNWASKSETYCSRNNKVDYNRREGSTYEASRLYYAVINREQLPLSCDGQYRWHLSENTVVGDGQKTYTFVEKEKQVLEFGVG